MIKGLTFILLDLNSLNLLIFTDAFFVNNKDLSLLIGFIIAFINRNQFVNIFY